jgi:hypothetical protein
MNADELRVPLTESERERLIDSCLQSGVPVKITDPVLLARAAALLPALRQHKGEKVAS